MILINWGMLMFPCLDCGGQPWSRTCPKSPLHRKTVIKRVSKKLFAIKTLNNSQLTSPSKFHRVTLVTTVSHVGSEITRGTRSKSESTAVAIFKFSGSEIVLSKVKAHILSFHQKDSYKHRCHFEGGVG